MIRYYAYYSCGGYKDLFLGDNSLKCDNTFFLPLLAAWIKGSKPEYSEKLKQVEGLQQIKVVSKNDSFGFPPEAKNLFSHGGYRLIYLTLSNGDTCLCVRDITNGARDEEDRTIPFNILITASGKDIKFLDRFGLESLNQISELYELMSTLFSYDPKVNGIKFNLGKLESAIYNASPFDEELEHCPNHINFMVIDSVGMTSTALQELDLKKDQIDYIKYNDGEFLGQLCYKVKAPSVDISINDSQPSITEGRDVANVNDSDNFGNELSEKITPSIDNAVHQYGNILPEVEPLQTESQRANKESIKENELIQQYSNILSSLTEISELITILSKDLGESKSNINLEVKTILDKIDSLKEDSSKSFSIISTAKKNKVYILINGVALLIGILLGALIF